MATTSRFRPGLVAAALFAAVPLAFLAALAWYQSFGNVPSIGQAQKSVLATFDIILTASSLDEAIQDAETGQRGFLITGDARYREPYDRQVPRVPGLMSRLQELLVNRPDQQKRVLALQNHVTTKLNELAATFQAMGNGGFEAARALVLTDVGRQSMAEIRTEISDILAAANTQLQTALAEQSRAEQINAQLFMGGSIAAFLALLVGFGLIFHSYNRTARSERVLQATLESVREGVSAFDERGRLVAWNALFANLLQVPRNLLKRGEPLASFVPKDRTSAPPLIADLSDLDRQARRDGVPVLLERRRQDGVVVELYHNPQPDGGFVTSYIDVTDQRRTEAALRQSQKLDSIGKMTGGVAHDFNNLLMVITGNLDLLRQAVRGNQKAERRLDLLVSAAERGAKLNKQLLAFARRQPLEPEITNLSTLLPDVVQLVRRAVGEAIMVECVDSGGLWNTLIDPTQLESAVLNLALNARDAMRNGGKLTIEVSNSALDDSYAAQNADVNAGQYVLLAVTDTGDGMSPDIAARAFDPFFTTKASGDGTGLGLSMVYGFVKQSGGHVKIYSEPGEGTTIKLYLPRAMHSEAAPIRRLPTLMVAGSERILLVDDDEIVRTTLADMLEDLGYTVELAVDGAIALARIEQDDGFDLLLTDVVMPGPVTSRMLASRAQQLRADLKVLFISGYTENAIIHQGRVDPGVQLLSKPFTRERLSAKVRQVLDQTASEAASARQS